MDTWHPTSPAACESFLVFYYSINIYPHSYIVITVELIYNLIGVDVKHTDTPYRHLSHYLEREVIITTHESLISVSNGRESVLDHIILKRKEFIK